MVLGTHVVSRRDTSDYLVLDRARQQPRGSGAFEVRLNARRLQLIHGDLFLDDDRRARWLIDQAFGLDEVRSIVVRREHSKVTIDLAPSADATAVWQRLAALLREVGNGVTQAVAPRTAALDLAGPAYGLPVRVTRAGNTLTTFRTRVLAEAHLLIGHPLLRQHGTRERFEDLLRSVHGVTEVRSVRLGASVLIVYDSALIGIEQILRLAERAWPEVVDGEPLVPRPRKLIVATGLLAFSFTAQFLRPVLLPWATAAAALYALPNLFAALRDLARGRIGLPALYTAGLGFLLWNRLPFASGVMSVFRQLWPSLANRLVANAERRLFAEQRRRLAWARLEDTRHGEISIDLGDLKPGAAILVHAGDFLPADGVVIDGNASIDEDILTGARGAADKTVGDWVYAGTFVREGSLTVRVERVGVDTTLAVLSGTLPRGVLTALPSSAEAERIANRNAKPALAAAALLLLATRTPRLSQVVIRPDYATAPRLSAHVSALTAIAELLSQGVLIRHPASLDQLSAVDVYVFDDSVDFVQRSVNVAKVNAVTRAAGYEALVFAASAFAGHDDARAIALHQELDEDSTPSLTRSRRQHAGAVSFWDRSGAEIVVTTPARALAEHFVAPSSKILNLVERLAAQALDDPAVRPLVVTRDRRILGVIQFERQGALRVAEIVTALRAQHPEARFVHVSGAPQDEAEARTEGIGFDAVFGGLDTQAKASTIRSLSAHTAWLGDGTDPEAAVVSAASIVSISLAGLANLSRDTADIVLLRDDLRALLAPRAGAITHLNRLQADYRTVYLANLLGVASGFVAGFGSLRVGLISNLGSAAVFLSRWRALAGSVARASRVAETRRVAVPLSAPPQGRHGLLLESDHTK
ncbi:ATPase [Azomonas macrocytogenes]|uniref:Cation transport ATPase n=1 Tax=Azomonas macrocytogenes TaxID=69962 RepID=A0A839T2H1_AZOMA|nr:ATPase [Azomonas macrocytogenes]MBB3102574.1 cation transport ATPase [Azomonas macrocytogenes]